MHKKKNYEIYVKTAPYVYAQYPSVKTKSEALDFIKKMRLKSYDTVRLVKRKNGKIIQEIEYGQNFKLR